MIWIGEKSLRVYHNHGLIMIRNAFLISVGILAITSTAVAHSGRTNADGCHNDTINGGYHCHNSGITGFGDGGFPSLGVGYLEEQPCNMCGSGLAGVLCGVAMLLAGFRFLPDRRGMVNQVMRLREPPGEFGRSSESSCDDSTEAQALRIKGTT